MVNTSAREGLPNAFLEAAAHKCAILGAVDPDGFTSRFGFHVRDDDFSRGLNYLLENRRWAKLGERGYHYVKGTFETSTAIDQHLEVYDALLQAPVAQAAT